MNVSQYDQRFIQLSKYVDVLVKGEVEKTKRFVKGLKPEIRGRLIPLQLRNYLQAVEKSLEVEMDMWHRDLPVINDSGLMQLFKEENGPEVEDHG